MTGPQQAFEIHGWVGDVATTMCRYSDPPGHFHASSRGREAAISIEHLSVLKVDLPRGKLDSVQVWDREHRKWWRP